MDQIEDQDFDLMHWLLEEVGISIKPDRHKARKNMYRKMVRMALLHGRKAYDLYAECWAYAGLQGAKNPRDEYFVWLVRRRMIEQGMWDDPKRFARLDPKELIRQGFPYTKQLPLFKESPKNGNGKHDPNAF